MLIEATEQHLSSIVELVNFSYRNKNHQGWTSEALLVKGDRINAQQLRELNCSDSAILLLLLDDGLAGCVHVQKSEDAGYIGMLTIHPDFQNQGIGKQLLQAAEIYLTEKYAIYTFKMSVLSARSELIAFYQRRGYQFISQVDDYPIHANVGQPLLKDLTVLHLVKHEYRD
ncbi:MULTISPECIES: GNAT family N-acetyltransferase [unclassified Acinetobacter]|uniref:GNAT family N-acetyltransferase n=1 Tax=unclassified Acinetobacter TaxID=196816 RepID=UPI00190B2923|nr:MULTISPECIES: GNAT family N-acetyltransferase [unclassified Acinetobacter]MBK0064675.1 GNAT family N-acetyltransferase [Acinetobacter sp. S55]MBK0068087.1 GNAT family N-acetyltransferase [Acinetobacter sp. S54]